MPLHIEILFFHTLNSDIANLHVTCSHREDIKLHIGRNNYIANKFPHLLKGKSFNLLERETKLGFIDLMIIMCTCLDIVDSVVSEFLLFIFVNFDNGLTFKNPVLYHKCMSRYPRI